MKITVALLVMVALLMMVAILLTVATPLAVVTRAMTILPTKMVLMIHNRMRSQQTMEMKLCKPNKN